MTRNTKAVLFIIVSIIALGALAGLAFLYLLGRLSGGMLDHI